MRSCASALAAAVVLLVVGHGAAADDFPRFFVMGDGRLAVENMHTGARADVRYRRDDWSYDDDALARLRQAFRSAGDAGEGRLSLRLVEVLSRLQHDSGVRPLRLVSGYRSPDYNEAIRQRGAKAAGGSLHTEGLAADVAFPRTTLKGLWLKLRALDCCGAGYYAKEGFLHVDVGRPRFWEPQTSRVDENLSAGNARIFARTEFDRYAMGESIVLTLYAITEPPVRIARAARLVGATGGTAAATIEGDHPAGADGCVDVDTSGTSVRATLDGRAPAGHLELTTCAPRTARTPELVGANRTELR